MSRLTSHEKKKADLEKGQKRADEWNAANPVGTWVCVQPVKGLPETYVTQTRSEAWILGDGSPVVSIRGKTGGWHLDHMTVSAAPTYFWHESPGSDDLWYRLHPAKGPDDLLPPADVISMWPEGPGWGWQCLKDGRGGAGLAGFLRVGTLDKAKAMAVEHARTMGVIAADAIVGLVP